MKMKFINIQLLVVLLVNCLDFAKYTRMGTPLRPVVSMVGTAEYGLSKYLDNIIKPFMPADYMANSTTQFLDCIKAYQFNPSDFMVSFDVVSLFTNVPLKET